MIINEHQTRLKFLSIPLPYFEVVLRRKGGFQTVLTPLKTSFPPFFLQRLAQEANVAPFAFTDNNPWRMDGMPPGHNCCTFEIVFT